jgi:hypothetical protein
MAHGPHPAAAVSADAAAAMPAHNEDGNHDDDSEHCADEDEKIMTNVTLQ